MLLFFIVSNLSKKGLALLVVVPLISLITVGWFKPSLLPRYVHVTLSQTIHVYLCWRYPIKDQVGSRSLPTCSYSWPNGQGDVGKFLEGLDNSEMWGRKHGVLTKSEHVQSVFNDSDKHFKALNNNSGYVMGQLLGKCVGLISGQDWQTVRATTEVPFVHSNMAQHVPMVRRHVESYMEDLKGSKNLQKGLIHPAEDLKFIPFWIVAEVFYGTLPPPLVQCLERLIPLREDLFKDVIRGGLTRYSFMRYLPTETGKKLADFRQQWHSFNRSAYQHSRLTNPSVPIVRMYEAANQGTISHEQLLQTIDEALFANLDVTIGGLSWNLVFLAVNPGSQEKLRAEVLSHGPETVDAYVQSSTTFLAACILESARLKPLAAFSMPQSALTDRLVNDFIISVKTDFIVDAYALNTRNPFWGAEAQRYKPERFRKNKGTQLRYNYWRFGFGPRQCMGKYVADLVIRVLLKHLIRNYRLQAGEEKEVWARNGDVWIMHPDSLIRCERLMGLSLKSPTERAFSG